MAYKFNLVTCGCGHSFGTSGSRVNYCTKCGSTTNIKNVTGFENAEKLSVAVSTANIPKEISDELIEKIQKKENKHKSSSQNKSSDPFNLMKKATNIDGNLSKLSLDEVLISEGISDTTSEHLIGQAEMQGLLIRVTQNTWNWLS